MRVGTFKSPGRNDHKKVDEDTFRLVNVLSLQIEKLTQALNAKLTIPNNLNSETLELNLEDQTALDVKLQHLRGIPTDIWVTRAVGSETGAGYHPALTYEFTSEGLVRVTVEFSPTPTETVATRIVVLGN